MRSQDSQRSRYPHESLERFTCEVLQNAGVAKEQASIIANALVRADLRGVDSHGVARLPAYVRKFEAGGFNANPTIEIERPTPGTFVVDADDGPGQWAATEAIGRTMAAAEETGVALATVTNSNHFGTAAFYTEQASDRDCIGIAMTNVGPDVVPFGGIAPFLGTNPLSFSIPTNRAFDITLDMATSVVAMGKIDHVAQEENRSIPEDWAVDSAGEATTDPNAVAALRPLGGPKGYGLAIVVDVLCGLLSGAGHSPTVGPLYEAYDEPMRLGHLVGAIDVAAFRDVEAFKADVDGMIDELKAQEPRAGVDEIMLPGEIETRTRRENREAGVPLRDGVGADLRELADRYGVAFPDEREAGQGR